MNSDTAVAVLFSHQFAPTFPAQKKSYIHRLLAERHQERHNNSEKVLPALNILKDDLLPQLLMPYTC